MGLLPWLQLVARTEPADGNAGGLSDEFSPSRVAPCEEKNSKYWQEKNSIVDGVWQPTHFVALEPLRAWYLLVSVCLEIDYDNGSKQQRTLAGGEFNFSARKHAPLVPHGVPFS